jgi:preprotein translocase subunit SecF
MFIVNHRKFFYTFSTILVIASILAICIWGLDLGIDFKGGTLVELNYPTGAGSAFPNGRPDQATVLSQISSIAAVAPNLEPSIQPTGDTGYIIRLRNVTEPEKVALENALGVTSGATAVSASSTVSSTTTASSTTLGSVQEKQFDSIGPVLGAQAARASIMAIIFVVLAIVLFIAFAFRKVSQPISSWKYGWVAIIGLIHNVIIPTGLFAVLGHFYGYEVDTLFVTALLVVLGFSVHDTIVVFDRVRENLRHAPAKKTFAEIVGESINQTFTRSINTSLTALFALVVLYFVGGESTQHFALTLIVGIAAGTYSSICIGSPLLVTWEKWQVKKAQQAKTGKK